MTKHFLEDMVKVKRLKKENKKEDNTKNLLKRIEVEKSGINHVKNKSRYILWFIAFFSIVFCFFAISFLFSSAEIKLDPKIKEVTLNENLSASKNSSNGDLPFDLVIVSGEESKTIQTTEKKDVTRRAEGVVKIYNSYSSSPQTFNIDTRLEGSNGKIYKTKNKVIVPGRSKTNVPRSVEVNIYATEAGEEYNSVPLDFKIVGFKGTPKYSKFYARSTSPITGGLKGSFPSISETEKSTVLNELKNTLQAKLLTKANTDSNGFVLFKNAIIFNTDDGNVDFISTQDNALSLKLKGTLYGFLFNEQKLTKKIAEDNIEKYDGSDVYIPNIRDLIFSLSTQMNFSNKDDTMLKNITNINFNLSGSAKIIWKIDENKILTDLLGKSKKDFNKILLQYNNISSAILTLNPAWKMSIPDKSKDVKIIVNYPN
jgi:hypothetical protein